MMMADEDDDIDQHEALWWAAGELANAHGVQVLIAQQASVHWRDADGATALHNAANRGNTDSCQILLDHRADVNALDRYHQTPLHLAAYNNLAAVCHLLLDNRADCTLRTVRQALRRRRHLVTRFGTDLRSVCDGLESRKPGVGG